ncbi:unnamed protein product [Ixodes hexagonus]
MLQQILRDMYIDPQLLAELDEEQRHILFCKMREEQVRRWEQREKAHDSNGLKGNILSRKPGCKRVDFLLGDDGEPWTWVMGEHPEDPSIEEIVERETKDRARRLAASEALELREQEESEAVPTLPSSPPPSCPAPSSPLEVEVEGEVVQLRRKKPPLEKCFSLEREVAALLQGPEVGAKATSPTVDRSTWLSQKQQEIRNREESLKQLMEQRSNEIYQEMKAQQRKSLEAAERESMVQEQLWMQQEKRAKEVEKQIREIARLAREEHRRGLLYGTTTATPEPKTVDTVPRPNVPPKVAPVAPQTDGTLNGHSKAASLPSHATSRSKDAKLFSKADIMDWFLTEEYPKGAVMDHNCNNPAIWFHGFITRSESEQLLQHQSAGSFLVRVHERIRGYVISYWAGDRCKHYLIDASLGHCQFFGSNQAVFPRLRDLVWHHTSNPITAVGQEQLLSPCPRNNSNSLPSLLATL